MKIQAKKLIAFLGMLIFSLVSFSATHAESETPKSLDRQLIDSLIAKDYDAAKYFLEQGANPEAILGEEQSDHAVCSAIDDRSSHFIELLVEFGASPNAYFEVGYQSRRTPLACAVHLYNPQAFEFLIAIGAEPNVDLCKECEGIFSNRSTILTTAVTAKYFPFAIALAKKYKPHPNELDHIKRVLEIAPYNEAHPWNDMRNELIQWVFDQGIEFKPLPAGKPVNGVIHECVFSFRDMEEGLAKGTICRE